MLRSVTADYLRWLDELLETAPEEIELRPAGAADPRAYLSGGYPCGGGHPLSGWEVISQDEEWGWFPRKESAMTKREIEARLRAMDPKLDSMIEDGAWVASSPAGTYKLGSSTLGGSAEGLYLVHGEATPVNEPASSMGAASWFKEQAHQVPAGAVLLKTWSNRQASGCVLLLII